MNPVRRPSETSPDPEPETEPTAPTDEPTDEPDTPDPDAPDAPEEEGERRRPGRVDPPVETPAQGSNFRRATVLLFPTRAA